MLDRLIEIINAQHGSAFVARGRYPIGEQGAFAVIETISGRSQEFVLKWNPGTTPTEALRAARLAERLRAVGYPAPHYRLVGTAPELGVVYSVQEALPGFPMGDLLEGQIFDQVLKLIVLQRRRADTVSEDWPRAVVEPVLHGGDGFCLLDPIRTYSGTTSKLLDALQRLAAAPGMESRAMNDVVHFDFQGANILVDGDSIGGVVDWEGWCAGDASFDLATLYFYTDPRRDTNQAQRDRLWNLVLATTGPRLLGAYLAHLILRQLDWSIRFHDSTAVDHWLHRCQEVLKRLAVATDNNFSV